MNSTDKRLLRDNIGTHTGDLTGPILDLIDWGVVRTNKRGLRVIAVVKGVHRVNRPRDIGAERLVDREWDKGFIWTDDIITIDTSGDCMIISKNVRQPLAHSIVAGNRHAEHLDAGTALALRPDDIDRIDPAGRSRRDAMGNYPGSLLP